MPYILHSISKFWVFWDVFYKILKFIYIQYNFDIIAIIIFLEHRDLSNTLILKYAHKYLLKSNLALVRHNLHTLYNRISIVKPALCYAAHLHMTNVTHLPAHKGTHAWQLAKNVDFFLH